MRTERGSLTEIGELGTVERRVAGGQTHEAGMEATVVWRGLTARARIGEVKGKAVFGLIARTRADPAAMRQGALKILTNEILKQGSVHLSH